MFDFTHLDPFNINVREFVLMSGAEERDAYLTYLTKNRNKAARVS